MSSYDDYSEEYSDEESYSESESQKRKKDKKEKKRLKKEKKKEKKMRKKEKKKHKKDKKRHKKEGRHRCLSASGSRSRSRGRGGPPPPRGRSPPARQRSRSRDRGPMPESRPPMMALPTDGRRLTLAEACESAGRGVTTGQTAQDDEVQVLGPDEEPADVQPFKSFDECRAFPREIREELKRAGFPAPSQIQAWTWPLGVKGKDIIGIAATGSGKTLAFLLPAFTQMDEEGHRPERDGPGLLVMSPTRELAQQTEVEATRFGKSIGFRCVAMYGGAPKGQQMSKYRMGVHSVIACPGRLNDFLEGGQIKLDRVGTLVLDEADRMLDMGFEPQIRKILNKIPRKRHTLFFTATWPKEVRQLASEILTRPYKVMIGNRDELKGNQDIIQLVRIVDAMDKARQIDMLLREAGLGHPYSAGKALVFCNTKRMCEQLSNQLARQGLPCTSIHGDKDQMQRDDALNGLKNGRFKVLVATDVAARGLDIKGVGLVLNFDPANNTEDYVHRIGRTGRAGAKGYAVTFLSSSEGNKAHGIVEVMERTNQEISPELRALASTGGGGGGKGRHRGGKGGGKGRSRSRSRSRSCSF